MTRRPTRRPNNAQNNRNGANGAIVNQASQRQASSSSEIAKTSSQSDDLTDVSAVSKDSNGKSRGSDKVEKKLNIIPIGGMGEIGKNMLAFEYDDEILLVDGGLAFPDADMLGVDILVPKIDWVVENSHKIVAWVLTHGHEDHIGGLPYMLGLLPKMPMYGAKLTLGLLRGKFEEFQLSESDVDLHEISTDDRIKVSKYFTVDFFRMTHSIPDNSGLIIHTPIGRIVHTGDFKLDYNPADGKTSHLHKLAHAGQEGVLALISDSTRAEAPGHSPSESDVMKAIEDIVEDASGRVVVATFSSHIHRLQNVIRIAEKYDRRVVVEGRSMVKNVRIAQELGYLEVKTPLAQTDEMNKIQDDKLLFLTTGSQGQPMAALSRLASDNHAKLSLKPGDTVILSSHPIPGNEEAVGRIINQLYAKQVKVYYPPQYKVHTSGHAYQGELKLILDLTRPKFFIPWHGEIRHQVNHRDLASAMAYPPEKSIIPENGDILTLTRDTFNKTGQIEVGAIYLDNVNEVSMPMIRDRQMLSNEGVVVIMALMNRKNPMIEVISRGVVAHREEVHSEIERIAMESLNRGMRDKKRLSDIRDDIFYPVRRYLRKETGQNPIIVPTVVES